MRVLLVHNEAAYFGGAETVLGYFLQGLVKTNIKVTVAAAQRSRMAEIIPAEARVVWVGDNSKFSITKVLAQALTLRKAGAGAPFDLVHGWAARDWELARLAGLLAHRPVIGTLHDHPQALFLSRSRQRLMRWTAASGLRQVVCVSEALREAGRQAGFPARKLTVIHNGIPPARELPRRSGGGPVRLGFLGVFSERKGLHSLFQALPELARRQPDGWELHLAGSAQDSAGEKMVSKIVETFQTAPWWRQVHWHGWIRRPEEFLGTLDLLICCSSDFDPFPTVILEAGRMGLPVVAARVGGVAEMIQEGRTGWMYESGNAPQLAQLLGALIANRTQLQETGISARERVRQDFNIEKMVVSYSRLYSQEGPGG